jgi:hypothetical protein
MNLNHNPSLEELDALIEKCKNRSDSVNIIVNHEGDVLVKTKSFGAMNIYKYKFHISGISTKAFVISIESDKLNYVSQVYKDLMYCWENDLKGEIDYNKITVRENVNHWRKVNHIPSTIELNDNDFLILFFNGNVQSFKYKTT